MAGRALVFSNPEVIEAVRKEFIPYAGDQWYLHRKEDAEGDFFWKVVAGGHMRHRPVNETRQGVYVATPEGSLLASTNPRAADRALEMFNSALLAWRQPPDQGSGFPRPLGPVAGAGTPVQGSGRTDPTGRTGLNSTTS